MVKKNDEISINNNFEELDSLKLEEIEGGENLISDVAIKIYRGIINFFN